MAKMSFDVFMAKVETQLNERIGLGVNDIPDFCYYDYWDDGISVKETVNEAIEAAGTY